MNLYNLQQRYRAGAARRSQGGFTMVELAIVLVIAGIILVGALKGTDMINKAKIERAVSDLKGFQTMIFENEKRTGHMAGDCDGDGIIGVDATKLFLARLPGTTWEDNAAPDSGTHKSCGGTRTLATDEVDPNTVLDDLRKSNIIDASRINRFVVKSQTSSFYAIGSLTINKVPTNVIFMYDVPLWMAKGIDVAIDGATPGDTGGATGRVRMMCNATAGDTCEKNGIAWPTSTSANDDEVVALYFQFDRAASSTIATTN